MAKIIQLHPSPEEQPVEIKLVAVDKHVDSPTTINQVTYYPDEVSLRKDRLSDPSMIWLDELADKKCKKCYGTGIIGYMVWQGASEFKKYLLENLEGKDLKALSEIISNGYGVPISVELLTEIAKLPKGGPRETAVNDLTKALSERITKRNPVWCRCFIANYNNKVIEIKRLQQFGVAKKI